MPSTLKSSFFVSVCVLHPSCLTITAGTANYPILGGLDSSLHLLRRELGSLTCLRMTLPEHGASIYSMIRTACQPGQIASLFHAWLHMWRTPTGTKELGQSSYTRPIRRCHKLCQPYSYWCCLRHEPCPQPQKLLDIPVRPAIPLHNVGPMCYLRQSRMLTYAGKHFCLQVLILGSICTKREFSSATVNWNMFIMSDDILKEEEKGKVHVGIECQCR